MEIGSVDSPSGCSMLLLLPSRVRGREFVLKSFLSIEEVLPTGDSDISVSGVEPRISPPVVDDKEKLIFLAEVAEGIEDECKIVCTKTSIGVVVGSETTSMLRDDCDISCLVEEMVTNSLLVVPSLSEGNSLGVGEGSGRSVDDGSGTL